MVTPKISRPIWRRFTIWQAIGLVCAAGLAFSVVAFVRGPDPFRQHLQTAPEGDLVRILSSLSSEAQALDAQVSSLKLEFTNLEHASVAEGNKSTQLSEQLAAVKILAGLTPVVGPGIEIRIEDSSRKLKPEVLLGMVSELKDAGAEALSINNQRVGTASWFGGTNTITLDGQLVVSPYIVSAIGPADAMEGGLKIPGGSLDTLRAEKEVQVDVRRVEELHLPSLRNPPDMSAARPTGK